jgi:hypothetical protein
MKKFFDHWATLPAPKQAGLILVTSGLVFTVYSAVGVVIVQPIGEALFPRVNVPAEPLP